MKFTNERIFITDNLISYIWPVQDIIREVPGSQENPENGSSGDSLLTKDDSFNRKVEKQSMEKGTGNESHD